MARFDFDINTHDFYVGTEILVLFFRWVTIYTPGIPKRFHPERPKLILEESATGFTEIRLRSGVPTGENGEKRLAGD
jgi:hypothetical protein